MKTTRKIVQILLFVLFIYMLFATLYPGRMPDNPFTRISPLHSAVLFLSGSFKPVFWSGVLILGLTLLLGRFFCGWVCPMGTNIDMGEKILGNTQNRNDQANYAWIKYIILTAVLFSALFKSPSAHWFAPVTILYRFYTFSVFPLVNKGWRLFQGRYDILHGIEIGFADISFRTGLFFFFGVMGIFLLGRINKRFWCRNLCPLGALLSLAGGFSIIRKKVSNDCIKCGKCTRECKMGAIPQDPQGFKAHECIYCFDCVDICPVKAVSFKVEKPAGMGSLPGSIKNFISGKKSPNPEMSSGFSRRNFLEGAAAGVAIASLSGVDYNKDHKYPRLIRPPGALPEPLFVNSCIRCGECMKACITGGLQPTLFEAGYRGFMTPRLIPSAGHCEFFCTMCQKVCPTGAIQNFEVTDKPHIKLGAARIDRNSCIAWYRDEFCLVCDEHCPYKAVYWKKIDGRLRPFVDPDLCVGCGYCENRCPVKPEAAIKVYTQGENRVSMKQGKSWQEINPLPVNSLSSRHQVRPPAPDYHNSDDNDETY